MIITLDEGLPSVILEGEYQSAKSPLAVSHDTDDFVVVVQQGDQRIQIRLVVLDEFISVLHRQRDHIEDEYKRRIAAEKRRRA